MYKRDKWKRKKNSKWHHSITILIVHINVWLCISTQYKVYILEYIYLWKSNQSRNSIFFAYQRMGFQYRSVAQIWVNRWKKNSWKSYYLRFLVVSLCLVLFFSLLPFESQFWRRQYISVLFNYIQYICQCLEDKTKIAFCILLARVFCTHTENGLSCEMNWRFVWHIWAYLWAAVVWP